MFNSWRNIAVTAVRSLARNVQDSHPLAVKRIDTETETANTRGSATTVLQPGAFACPARQISESCLCSLSSSWRYHNH